MNAIELGPEKLALAALLVVANAAVSLALRLGLGQRLLVAAVRATLQLLVLGFLLGFVFESEGPALVVPWMLAMTLVAGFEAVRRTSRRVPGVYPGSMLVILVSSMAVTLFALRLVIDVEPWYTPRYAIPILGMVLGNTLNGISLGLETLITGLAEERAKVELLLAHGATQGEAARDVVRRSIRVGMIPILNSMAIAGTVSIPGMMTGQILAGESPLAAARYQIFILFAIAGGVALGTSLMVLFGTRLLFDDRDRLRVDRIRIVE